MRVTIYSKGAQRLIDATTAGLAWLTAYQIRFEGQVPPLKHEQMLLLLVPLAAGQVVISSMLGIYRYQWRYLRAEDALHIARAYLPLSLLLFFTHILLGASVPILEVPFSVIGTTFMLSVGGAVCVRLGRRFAYQRSSKATSRDTVRRYLIVGAGLHGATVAREMVQRKGIKIAGFVDDDPDKQGAVIAGVTVIGRTADLQSMVSRHNVDEVLVCISPKSRHLLRISELESGTGIPVRSRLVPTIEDILDGKNSIPILSNFNLPDKGNGHRDSSAEYPAYPKLRAIGGDARAAAQSGAREILAPSTQALPRTALFNKELPVTNKTILITGGAGFIGSNLAEKLVEHNAVVLLDQNFAAAPIQYTSLLAHPNVRAVCGNILEVELRSLVKDADVVVHTAAILGVNRVCHSGRETLETNYVGTSRLLKALDASPNLERFVYFSTSEVFGVNSYRVDEASRPSVGPIAESRWSYAMSKLAGEHLVASYFREAHLPTVIVRPFNIFGPRRSGDYALRRFILSALQGEPLEIYGDGTQIRSWCYIEDFCSALLQMISRAEAVGEDFNIGHPGNTLTVYELAKKVIQLAESSSPILFCESPFPDISIRVPSLEKARRLLGYDPQYDLKTGLELTIQWHCMNCVAPLASIPTTSHLPTYASNPNAA
jgi:nucleoside-diphosphate-sugar epimerase